MNELPTHLIGVRVLVARCTKCGVAYHFDLPGPSLTRGGCYLRRGCFLMGVGIAHHLAHHLPALVLMLMDSARSSLFKAMVASFAACLKADETEPDKDDETKSDDDVVFIAR